MKGPLETPVGKGFPQPERDTAPPADPRLFACIRPSSISRHRKPGHHPERVDMVVFRENTEDVLTPASSGRRAAPRPGGSSPSSGRDGRERDAESGIGHQAHTAKGFQAPHPQGHPVRLDQKRRSVTMAHKGNIMKFTEGAFPQLGHELAPRSSPAASSWKARTAVPSRALCSRTGSPTPCIQEVLIPPRELRCHRHSRT
jgi:isocitrate dehydrogenase